MLNICYLLKGAIEFIGKRWMGMIIYRLLEGPKRYHELLEEIDGISDYLLTERLVNFYMEGMSAYSAMNAAAKMFIKPDVE